jgi:hypothetical protein
MILECYETFSPLIPSSVEFVIEKYKHLIDIGYEVEHIHLADFLFKPKGVKRVTQIEETNINNITMNINQNINRNINKNIKISATNIPNLIVVDNFYKNPQEVREYALSLKYLDPDQHGAVGFRSEGGRKIFDGTKEYFEHLMNSKITNGKSVGEWDYQTNGCFQWCNAKVPLVYHCDSQQYAGIVYLTPDAPPNCGTSFFRHKKYKIRNSEIFSKSDWYQPIINYKEPHLDKSQWEPVDNVGNVFNRLVIFDAQYIHAVTEYFGEDIHNSRLFQLFFFNIS